MIVVNKQCKICTVIKRDKRLLNRLYNSNYYIPHGTEGLIAIHADYSGEFSLPALKNHARKHQFINSSTYNAEMLKRVDKQAEQRIVRQAIKAKDAIQTVIDKGYDRLDNQEITVDTNQLIRASQIKMQDEAKEKDHQLQMVEMIAHFASASDKGERIYVENTDAS